MINVTKTLLPPFDAFTERLRQIWETGQLTNHGPLLTELEARLAERLEVRHCIATCNGTIALQIAVRALELHGDVITTPFSYVATTSSLVWERCRPVFVDVEPDGFCLDAEQAERACDANTSGIVATHVYGNACDVDALTDLARRRGLKLLFDAAHAFDARLRGRQLATWGDASVLSFHATKLFHSAEGGAIVTDSEEVARRARLMRNFGHDGYDAFAGLGINGKMSELHAAMGLCLLPLVEAEIARRANLASEYDTVLCRSGFSFPAWRSELKRNFAYYPLLFETTEHLRTAMRALAAEGFSPRRYFFPPLNKLPYVEPVTMPTAESIASRVLCLPMGSDVDEAARDRILSLLGRD